jgi:hypothetical protein
LYCKRLWARPRGFFFLSCFATLGVCPRTLPARASDPWTFPAQVIHAPTSKIKSDPKPRRNEILTDPLRGGSAGKVPRRWRSAYPWLRRRGGGGGLVAAVAVAAAGYGARVYCWCGGGCGSGSEWQAQDFVELYEVGILHSDPLISSYT